MRVTRLSLENVRAITRAEFTFQAGFNLIVGVNGVGKTTVLEAISRGLAQAIQKTYNVAVAHPTLTAREVRHGAVAATTVLELDLAGEKVQVQERHFRPGVLPLRPGDMESEIDVHARGLQRRGRLKRTQREAQETVLPESGPKFLPDEKAFRAAAAREDTRLLAVYFSTTRASAAGVRMRTRRAVAPSAVAYADAFIGRDLPLGVFADWLSVLHDTADERKDARPILAALNAAVRRFLPGYLRIRPTSDEPKQLLIDQSERETVTADRLSLVERQQLLVVLQGVTQHMSTNWPPGSLRGLTSRKLATLAAAERARVADAQVLRHMAGFASLRGPLHRLPDRIEDEQLTGSFGRKIRIDRLPRHLDVSQLSDGERSVLALVLDLTRRLAQANVGLPDPAANAAAIVLIDELELHLHPGWQRSIADHLTQTFPRCQFIATTHSPQAIGEARAGHVVLMHQNGPTEFPIQAFGMDSNWILRHVMEADDRNRSVSTAIGSILDALREGRTQVARARVEELRMKTGETPDLADALARIGRAEALMGTPKRDAAKRGGRRRQR